MIARAICIASLYLLVAFSARGQCGGSAALDWQNPQQNTDGTTAVLTGTRVYWGTGLGAYSQTKNLGVVTATSIDQLCAGTWFFVTTALNSNGESVYSNSASKVIAAAPVFAPNVPTGFSMTFKPTPVVQATLGDSIAGTSSFPGDTNRGLGTEFIAPASGTLGIATARFDAGSGAGTQAKVLVYSSSTGVPKALIAASPAMPVPQGGGLVTFGQVQPAASVVASSAYVVIVTFSSFNARAQTTNAANQRSVLAPNMTFANPPAQYTGTTSAYNAWRINAAVEIR